MKLDLDNLIPANPQPSRADALKNRALILETARQLFEERGVEAVTMTDIAEAAGVGKGTLYRHFENKMAVSEALLDDEQRQHQAETFERIRTQTDAAATLRWFVGATLDYVDRNAVLLCVGTQPTGSLQHPAHWWWRQTVRGLLEQMRPPGDLDVLADAIYILMDVHNVYFLRQVRGYSLARARDEILRIVDAVG
ncbi:MAG: TetR/AcrR family transcriptional regulator [Anaerolineae bacterium]|nr:TetR/AcrR family transcriptional regulator [Anaerolineae bacterium]